MCRSINTGFLLFLICYCSAQQNTLVPFLKKDKWGYADSSGKIIISPQFSWVGFFSEGLACVQKDGLFGFVNEKGKTVIELKFNSPAVVKGGIVEVSDGVEKIIYNQHGDVILSAHLQNSIEKKFRKKFGEQFTAYRLLTSGYVIAEKDTVFRNTENKKLQALVDRKGNYIIPRHVWLISSFTKNLFYAKSDKASYVYNTDGNIVLKDIVNITEKENGDLLIRTKSGLDYLDSSRGKIISLKTEYIDVNKTAGGFLIFTINRNTKQYYGIVTSEGNEEIPGKYSFLGKFSENKFIARDAKGFYGAYDTSGKIVIPFEYEFLERFSEGLALAKANGNWFYVNDKGKQIIKLNGDYKVGITEEIEPVEITTYVNGELYCFKEGLAVFFKNGKAGYINREGKIIIEPVYDFADPFKNGLARVYSGADNFADLKKASKILQIIIDKNGKEVIRFNKEKNKFNHSDFLQFTGATFINLGKEWIMYDRGGELIKDLKLIRIYPDVISDGKFIRVATNKQNELIIRNDGRLFLEE